MNRRSFLTTVGAASAALAVPLVITRKAESQTADTTLIQNATHLQQLAIANAFAGIRNGVTWSYAASATIAAANSIKSGGFDAMLQSAASKINPDNLNQNCLNKTAMVNSIRVYQPGFTLTALNHYLNAFSQGPAQIAAALENIKATGVSPLMLGHASRLNMMGYYLRPTATVSPVGAAILHPELPPDPEPEGGGGGYDCTVDSVLGVSIGLGLAVLGFMTAPVSGPVILLSEAATAVAGQIFNWGGWGLALWGAGHSTVCGF